MTCFYSSSLVKALCRQICSQTATWEENGLVLCRAPFFAVLGHYDSLSRMWPGCRQVTSFLSSWAKNKRRCSCVVTSHVVIATLSPCSTRRQKGAVTQVMVKLRDRHFKTPNVYFSGRLASATMTQMFSSVCIILAPPLRRWVHKLARHAQWRVFLL